MKAALIVPVPELAAVDAHRAALDPSHASGVPPHVTIMFPFGTPDEIGVAGIARLAQAIQDVTAFEASFTFVGWFGQDVAWLRPRDDSGFRRLTSAVQAAFPEFEPYEGAHDDVVPHLTIGTVPPAQHHTLRAAIGEVERALPLRTFVDAIH
ncbi:2'-5' RNA ligase family protein [Microbacterium sp. JZ31]|uniref:2'-5' RNA ligase family protein n=1 Tax=Microbacterium sp. JZ31 TaxID=1906274 RepID=UPI0019341EA8|nr:2'-5' RNA ligase family protein [Microbacterium sp. JZ31]